MIALNLFHNELMRILRHLDTLRAGK